MLAHIKNWLTTEQEKQSALVSDEHELAYLVTALMLEAAQIDGASRFQRVRYVILPHLMPLVTFVTLIQLMDNFRVFEPVIGFNAEAHATSLSWAIFNDLGGETRQFSSAAATSVITIIGVAILLTPVLIRTWRDFKGKM